MSTRQRLLPVSGLASLRNTRTRIYAPGADPKFRANPDTPRTFQLERVFPPREGANAADNIGRLWRRDILDRLQTPLTRRPE
jgi:hypothetical protein